MPADDRPTSPSAPSPHDARPLFRAHAELCRALGNEHRIAILHAVCEEEMCVGDLAAALELPAQTVSQHLRVLREHKLVRSRKDGQMVYYVVANAKFTEACVLIRQALLEQHKAEGDSLLAAKLLDTRHSEPAPAPRE